MRVKQLHPQALNRCLGACGVLVAADRSGSSFRITATSFRRLGVADQPAPIRLSRYVTSTSFCILRCSTTGKAGTLIHQTTEVARHLQADLPGSSLNGQNGSADVLVESLTRAAAATGRSEPFFHLQAHPFLPQKQYEALRHSFPAADRFLELYDARARRGVLGKTLRDRTDTGVLDILRGIEIWFARRQRDDIDAQDRGGQ